MARSSIGNNNILVKMDQNAYFKTPQQINIKTKIITYTLKNSINIIKFNGGLKLSLPTISGSFQWPGPALAIILLNHVIIKGFKII